MVDTVQSVLDQARDTLSQTRIPLTVTNKPKYLFCLERTVREDFYFHLVQQDRIMRKNTMYINKV